jgi:predicted transcriptional regulator
MLFGPPPPGRRLTLAMRRHLSLGGVRASTYVQITTGTVSMPTSTTMAIRLSSETKNKLERPAAGIRRSKSFLAAEAVSAYVEREFEIIDGMRRGMADVKTGRVVPHDEAMAEVQAALDAAKRGKA